MSIGFQPERNTLGRIKQPVEKEFKEFNEYFRSAMRSNTKLLDMMARYIVSQKGKRIRPLLVLLSAKAAGGVTPATYRAATLVEILHTATLVHDDVVDDANMRRGVASINAVWKNKVAVLMGDFLLSRGLLLSLEHSDYYFLRSTSNAVKRMSEGELLQIQKSRQLDTTEDTYLRIISDKTASLISTCTEIGAASATDDAHIIEQMKMYGEFVGMAFQIRDDLFDFLSEEKHIGKPIGNDIKEKKITLPLIAALRNASREESTRIMSIIKKGPKGRDIEDILQFVEQSGGISYARSKAEEFAANAIKTLDVVQESEARGALMLFIDYVMKRTN